MHVCLIKCTRRPHTRDVCPPPVTLTSLRAKDRMITSVSMDADHPLLCARPIVKEAMPLL